MLLSLQNILKDHSLFFHFLGLCFDETIFLGFETVIESPLVAEKIAMVTEYTHF